MIAGIVERRFHLADVGDDPLRFLGHVILLGRDNSKLVVKRLRQSLEEL